MRYRPAALFASWAELADRGRIADAVLICTQDALHVGPAVAFAELGYHVLLEKPMAITEADCWRMRIGPPPLPAKPRLRGRRSRARSTWAWRCAPSAPRGGWTAEVAWWLTGFGVGSFVLLAAAVLVWRVVVDVDAGSGDPAR